MKSRIGKWIVGAMVVLLCAIAGAFTWVRIKLADDCFTSDFVNVLSTNTHEGKTYSVQLVTGGFEDKYRVVYLYEGADEVEDCAEKRRPSLASLAIDESGEYRAIKKVIVQSLHKLDVVMTAAEAAPNARITVDWSKTRWR